MNVTVVGAGPGGLYAALLLKKSDSRRRVRVVEKNSEGATYGWGVVFSDRTLTSFREADYDTYAQIIESFVMWDSIDVRFRGAIVRCGGQVFSGIERRTLLAILTERCAALGVELAFDTEVSDIGKLDADLVIGADGVHSRVRDAGAGVHRPSVAEGRSRYIWFGTDRLFDSFTFTFRDHDAGLFQAHAYPYSGTMSTFIVECSEETWRRTGLDAADDVSTISLCERVFSEDLRGHALRSNRSAWVRFPTVRNRRWHDGNRVLLGDAAHTAHFSIGSGTKLAMEDAIALAAAVDQHSDPRAAVAAYELERKPRVERFQEAARQSQAYFEDTWRYARMDPRQFAFHLLTRSGRVDYNQLRVGDPRFVASVDRWFAESAGSRKSSVAATPPAGIPLRLRGLELAARVAIRQAPRDESVSGAPPGATEHAVRATASEGAALIVTEDIAVTAAGRVTPAAPGLYDEDHVAEWRRIVEAAHDAGSLVCARLSHAGRKGAMRPRHRGTAIALGRDGWDLIAPSSLPYFARMPVPRQMTQTDIESVVAAFATAAARAHRAGFDMVQIDAAGGHLVASFLSPLANQRSDRYGGSATARWRFLAEVFSAVRAALPDEVPVAVALAVTDWQKGGLTLSAGIAAAAALAAEGCDLVEVAAGGMTGRTKPRFDLYHLAHYSDRVRNEAQVATMATGAITTVDDVNTIVAAGRADLCSLLPPLALLA